MIVSLYGKLASLVMANETYLVLFVFVFLFFIWFLVMKIRDCCIICKGTRKAWGM